MGRASALSVCAVMTLAASGAFAADGPVLRAQTGTRVFTSSDTVGVGFLATSADPNKVHVGGVWDFDTPYYADAISGTDSTQFWTFVHGHEDFEGVTKFTTTVSRPWWYYDWGNSINAGDHNLWIARAATHRIFRRTGLAGVWHQDDLRTVPDTGTVSPGFATNISGNGSAWCGLRLSADPNGPIDPYTGNAYTSDLEYIDYRPGNPATRSHYPGYASQWDQLLYRDFPYDAGDPGTAAFDYRAELNNALTLDPGVPPNDGGGWFTPDPFSPGNLVCKANSGAEPVDSFEVWVGAPKETGIYDPAHRYLSDTIDFGQSGTDAPALIFSRTGVVSGSAAPAIPSGASWSTVRVVFRVKTNRWFDDARPWSAPNPTAWNSTTGAVVLDNVNVNGALSDFETPSQIRPRFTWTDLGGGAADVVEDSPSASWITTGRQPAHYGHVDNLATLPFAPLTSDCNMSGNVALQSNHDDPQHAFVAESQNWMISPTICLTGPRAADQGIPPTLRTESQHVRVVFDLYTGDGQLDDTGMLYDVGSRWMGSGAGMSQVAGPRKPAWTPMNAPSGDYGNDADSTCFVFDSDGVLDYGMTPVLAQVDSFQVGIQDQLRCARFAATACGQVYGHYMDNIQIQFIRSQPFTGVDPGAPVLDFVRGAYPNPSRDGSATVKFSLSRCLPVKLRFYDLRGALVQEAQVSGKPGENQYRWDGTTRTGTAVASGIYFYRLYADGVEFRNNLQRVVFIGRPDR